MTHNTFKRDIRTLQQQFATQPETFEKFPLSRPLTAITLGVGSRGNVYGNYALEHPSELNIIGVVEPDPGRQASYAERHAIHPDCRYGDWEEVFAQPRFADMMIISTPDQEHYRPAMKALEMGYHILLEKPIAPTLQQCLDIQEQARKYNRIVAVCHVLRYTPYFRKMKEIVDSGVLGRIVQVQHFEPIGYDHFAHSYVRGNWQDSGRSTPLILAKACHDMDVLRWIIGKRLLRVSSHGSLNWFHEGNAPAGSGHRCTECAFEQQCPYSALKIYYREKKRLKVFDLPDDPSLHDDWILEKLRSGPYGRCVYRSDNNQPDHYVAAMQFEDDISVNFSMAAFTSYEGRRTRILGTHGDIEGDMKKIVTGHFLTGESTVWESPCTYDSASGHAGGDAGIVKDFIRAVAYRNEGLLSSAIDVSIDSHIMGFMAEESRIKGKMIGVEYE